MGQPEVVDHEEVVGSCQSCHNGTYANPKPVNHPQTTADCGECHNTYTWTTVMFNHAGIVDNCVRCHNGSTATGKGPKHILTDNVCEDCHTTGAIKVKHDEMLYNHAASIKVSGGAACAYCHQPVFCARCHADNVLGTPARKNTTTGTS